MADRMRPSELLAYFFESLDHPDDDSVSVYRDRLTGDDKYEFIMMSAVFQAHMMRMRESFDAQSSDSLTIDQMIESAVEAMKKRTKKGRK
jgi:hypothetical protein